MDNGSYCGGTPIRLASEPIVEIDKAISAVTKLSCDDVYITQSKMASLSKKKALGVLTLMLLDGEEKARIKRRNRLVWVRGWIARRQKRNDLLLPFRVLRLLPASTRVI